MKQHKQQGISLVEVLISLVVVTVGLVALVQFQSDMMRNRNLMSQQSEAVTLANDKLDELRQYEVLDTTAGKKAYQDIASGSSTVSGTNATYNVVWTVTEVNDPPYKTIQVTVTWTDASNQSQTITLSSIVAKIDPKISGSISQGL